MSTASWSPQPGGSRTKGTKPVSMATWNIRCGRGTRMAAAAKGLAQMGVGIGFLTRTKVIDNRYSKSLLGYKVLVSKSASPHRGGIGLIWREDHDGFEVKAVQPLTPNLMSFQLVMGNKSVGGIRSSARIRPCFHDSVDRVPPTKLVSWSNTFPIL
jgi:hypothetical protein